MSLIAEECGYGGLPAIWLCALIAWSSGLPPSVNSSSASIPSLLQL